MSQLGVSDSLGPPIWDVIVKVHFVEVQGVDHHVRSEVIKSEFGLPIPIDIFFIVIVFEKVIIVKLILTNDWLDWETS